ncbi:MAG TPA: ADOP family duplicated permease [Vicinamibacterales bacterium]|nr:ADOP family duplicated permease [Vicinamibacterales bacterium]
MGWTRFFRRTARERERADEMRAHLDLYTDEFVGQGHTPDEARRLARLRFGNPRAKLEDVDDRNRLPVFDTLGRDLRYAVRVLFRAPAFTATTVVTLALVIGACTAVFSLANAILFTPPPYPEPDRLAFLQAEFQSARGAGTQLGHDAVTWEAVRDGVPSLDAAVYSGSVNGVNLIVGEQAAFVRQQRVGAGYFRVLGVPPVQGREFSPDEDVPGGPALAVVSHETWVRDLGAVPDIVGRTLLLRGDTYQVVGVMPEWFSRESKVDVWTPLRASRRGEGGGTNFQVIARLRPGASWDQANNELRSLGIEPLLARGFEPGDGTTAWLGTVPLHEVLAARSRAPIAILGAAVSAVLLIACVNIAALILARGSSRAKEIATRMALGSGRGAVVRQLMAESVVLGLVGGVAGVAVAQAGLSALQQLAATTYGNWADAGIDGRVLAVTAGLSVLTSLLFGLVPAFQASRLDVQGTLSGGTSRSVAGSARRWPRRLLVVSEVALGVALLVMSGLLVRTVVNVVGLDPGFDPDRLVTASVSLQDARYQASEDVHRLFDESLRVLNADPAIESAAVSLQLPYTRLLNWGFKFPDEPDRQNTIVNVVYVSGGFLETLGIPVRQGRSIASGDRTGAPPVAVVNETFERVFRRDGTPMLGRRLVLGGYAEAREIVGIAGDVQQTDSGFAFEGRQPAPLMTTPTLFLPAAQLDASFFNAVHTWFRPTWTVRARPGAQAGPAITRAIASVDPLLPVSEQTTIDTVMRAATAEENLLMTLVSVLAAAALLLAALGIHGLIAQSVAERRREFGIRIALGSTPGQAVGRAAMSGVMLAAVGSGLGALLSLWAVGFVQSFLWGVDAHDPLTIVGVGLVFVLVAAGASVLPALRILRLDPVHALRQ